MTQTLKARRFDGQAVLAPGEFCSGHCFRGSRAHAACFVAKRWNIVLQDYLQKLEHADLALLDPQTAINQSPSDGELQLFGRKICCQPGRVGLGLGGLCCWVMQQSKEKIRTDKYREDREQRSASCQAGQPKPRGATGWQHRGRNPRCEPASSSSGRQGLQEQTKQELKQQLRQN